MTEASEHRRAARRSLARAAATVVVLFVAFAFLPLRGDNWWIGATVGAVLLATIVPLAISRLRRVLTADRPGFEAAEALVQLVAMLITGFAAVLYAMNRNGTQLTGLDTRVDAIYFTVTVLSTVGFGDIHATSQAARIVVTIQILFDLAFLGVFVRIFLGAAKLRVDEKLTPAPGPDAD